MIIFKYYARMLTLILNNEWEKEEREDTEWTLVHCYSDIILIYFGEEKQCQLRIKYW